LVVGNSLKNFYQNMPYKVRVRAAGLHDEKEVTQLVGKEVELYI